MKSNSSFQFPLVGLIVVAFLGACMELDVSIPSFPAIMNHFHATEAQVQSTLSVNFLAFCLAGLLYGPLSEAWGRKKLMLFGSTCFLIGALGCVFSFSINQLIFWRFIQGIGTSSALVLGFAMISDTYQGELAAKKVGIINACCTIFMATAPVIGGLIIHHFNWRANYTFIAILAVISWVLLIQCLPETNKQVKKLNLMQIIKDYFEVGSHLKFILLACFPNMLVVAYLTFVGSAAFYYMNTCKLSALMFALHQGIIVAFFSFTSFFSGKIIDKIGGSRAVALGMTGCGVSAMLMCAFAFYYPYEPYLITSAMSIFAIGCAFPMSVTFAQSLEEIPHLKGVSSSFIMSSRMLLTSCGIYLTGAFFDGSMKPVAIVMLLSILLAVMMYGLLKVLFRQGYKTELA